MSGPQVEVVGITRFLGVPPWLSRHGVSEGQDQGSELARLVECAGRCCYDSYGRGRNSTTFHQHLLEVGHGSVLEHATISFFISGISRGCSHEWVRHRVGVAISQRSTRYVDESESEWAWHPALVNSGSVAALRSFQSAATSLYQRLVAELKETGMNVKQARGAARGVLGNALATEMVWTANLRAIRHIVLLRATAAADAEIRLLAQRIYEAAAPLCPEYFGDLEWELAPDRLGKVVRQRKEMTE